VVQRARRTRQDQVTYVLNSVGIDTERSLLQVLGMINKIKFNCVIDTGATMSVMSEKVAKRHNFPTNNRKIQIKLANGQVTMGRCTEQLLVEIQGKCSDLSFVILPQENIEIIIGLD